MLAPMAATKAAMAGEVPIGAVRDSKAPSNPAPCRVDSDPEAFVLALWGVLKVV